MIVALSTWNELTICPSTNIVRSPNKKQQNTIYSPITRPTISPNTGARKPIMLSMPMSNAGGRFWRNGNGMERESESRARA
jgi:hypothetical protein